MYLNQIIREASEGKWKSIWDNPGPNPINVFSASIKAMLKFKQSARLKVVL